MKSILISSPHSGCGKTSITIGLCRALARRGLRVQPFKCGPDYLDPGYLSYAAGRTCYNLDIWMQGADYTRFLFQHACLGMGGEYPEADIAVIEGAMGLYDGLNPETSDYSASAVANLLDVPVLLVCGAGAMSRSFAAVAQGMINFPDAPGFAGIVANQCGSVRHGDILRRAVNSVAGLPGFYGAVLKNSLPEIKSRHLGLHSAIDAEEAAVDMLPDELAARVEEFVEVDRLLQNLPEYSCTSGKKSAEFLQTYDLIGAGKPLRLGVAYDKAFHFYYPDNLWALQRCGFELAYFSPLADNALPENLHGVYIGGGYPEAHAEQLSHNVPMLASLNDFAMSGGVVYGECGGLMYLGSILNCLNGEAHTMCGLLPVETSMQKNRQALGYARAIIGRDCILGNCGQELRGHEYHYSSLAIAPEAELDMVYSMSFARDGLNAAGNPEGYCCRCVLGSYLHTHLASNPQALSALVAACSKA